MKLSQYHGDTKTHHIPLVWEDTPFAPGEDWNLVFTAKKNIEDPDDQAVFQKTTVGGLGITITGSTAAVEIVPDDTAGIDPGDLVWDIQAQHTVTRAIRTLALDFLTVIREVTRSTTVSVTVHTTNPPIELGSVTLATVTAALGYTPEDTANKSTDATTDAASDIKFPTVKAIIAWVTTAISNAISGFTSFPGFGSTAGTALEATSENVTNIGLAGTALQSVPPIFIDYSPTSDGSIVVSGTTSPDMNGTYYPTEPNNSLPCWTDNGNSVAYNLSNNQEFKTIYDSGGGWWVINKTGTDGNSSFSATSQASDPSTPMGKTYVTSNGTGTPILTAGPPPKSFIGQRAYVGTVEPYAVWECTGPDLSFWTKVDNGSSGVPSTRTINGVDLSVDRALADLGIEAAGAAAAITLSSLGGVPTSRTINGVDLSNDRSLVDLGIAGRREIKTSAFAAAVYGRYAANFTGSVTDPSSALLNESYEVLVEGGSVTIGGVAYAASRIPIFRICTNSTGPVWTTLTPQLSDLLTLNAGLTVAAGLSTFKEIRESNVAGGNTGTAKTISLTSGTKVTYTLTGNCTFTMPTASDGASFTLFLLTGAGSFTGTFTGVKWSAGTAPTITTTASRLDILSFVADGTNWYGSILQNFTP